MPCGVHKLGLCGVAVFVDESSEPVAPFQGGRGAADDVELATPCCRWRQMERAVRPVRVVVVSEHAEDALEMAKVDDQEPVEAFGAGGAYEALGDRVCLRRSLRCLDDFDPFSGEDGVEVARELAVAIADQEPKPRRLLLERPRELAGSLRHPGASRIASAAGEVDAPAGNLDEEQDVEPLQRDRLDSEKVDREHALRLLS